MITTENKRRGEVTRAQRAIRKAPDTRAIKRELAAGNQYVLRFLERRGLRVRGTTIHS